MNSGPGKQQGNGHIALQTECVRVANKLSVNEVPEWKEKNMEFALVLRYLKGLGTFDAASLTLGPGEWIFL